MSSSDTSTVSITASRIAFLDVARGLAALLVLAEHILDVLYPGFENSAGYAVVGKIGVFLFFLISGFIIPFSLQRAGSYSRFWLRRVFRLYPVYWLSIGLIALVLWCMQPTGPDGLIPGFTSADWLLNLTMLQGFFTGKHVLGVFWTLHLELIFYVGCCVICMFDWFKHIRFLSLVAFVVFALGEVLVILGNDRMPVRITSPMLVLLAPFVGCCAQQYVSGQLSWRFLVLIVAVQAIAFGVVWFVAYRRIPDEVSVRSLVEIAVTWGASYLFFFALLGLRHFRMPAVLCFLGRISYSIYLLHLAVIQVLGNLNIPTWGKLVGWIGLTIVLSTVTYYLVEEPGIKLGRWVEKRLFRPPQMEVEASAPAEATLVEPVS